MKAKLHTACTMTTSGEATLLADAIHRASLSPPEHAGERKLLYHAALQLASKVESPFETLNRLTFAVRNTVLFDCPRSLARDVILMKG